MSTYPVLNPRIRFTALPRYYPILGFSGGNVYQPAAYTEGNEDKASYSILLPIPGGVTVTLPSEVTFDPTDKLITCTLQLHADPNITEMRLAMMSFTVDPAEPLIISNPISIEVEDFESSSLTVAAVAKSATDNLGGGKLVGKVVMDSNILPS